MQSRSPFVQLSPGAYKAMSGLETYLRGCGLERKLIELIKLRASQINGCAFCVDMHSKDLRAAGETDERLFGVVTWRESPFFTARERAALEWTEAVTRVSETGVPDSVYEAVRGHFGEKELVDLTWVVAAINAWNRMAIAFRTVPGSHTAAHHAG